MKYLLIFILAVLEHKNETSEKFQGFNIQNSNKIYGSVTTTFQKKFHKEL